MEVLVSYTRMFSEPFPYLFIYLFLFVRPGDISFYFRENYNPEHIVLSVVSSLSS